MKKTFSTAFLIAGTVTGAGFASGREMRTFFAVYGAQSLWFVPLILLLLFLGCTVFLWTGKVFEPQSFSEVSRRIFGRTAVVFDTVMVLGNLIFTAGMLAAFDSLGQNILGLSQRNPSVSLTALILCSLIVLHGVKGLQKVNNFTVPIIVIFLAVVCLLSIEPQNAASGAYYESNPSKLLLNSVLFVYSNLFSCSNLLYASGKNSDKRALAAGSLLGSLIIAVLMLLFILAALTASPALFNADMPVFYLSQAIGGIMSRLSTVILIVAIFTTMLSNMYNLYEFAAVRVGDKHIAVVVIAVAAFAVRSLGFNIIVDYLYLYIGAFGAVYCLSNIIFLTLMLRREKNKIPLHI